MKWNRGVRLPVLCVPFLVVGIGKAAVTSNSTPTPQELNRVMRHGDATKAEAVATALKVGPGVVRMIKAQLDYNLPGLSNLLKDCRDAALRHNAISSALNCNRGAASVALVMGDARGYFQALDWTKNIGFPAIARSRQGRKPKFGRPFNDVDLDKLAKSLPPLSATLSVGSASLDYSHPLYMVLEDNGNRQTTYGTKGVGAIPEVSTEIDGKPVQALVDTGTSYFLTMDQTQAKALGVKILVAGLPAIATMGKAPGKGSTSFGLIDRLVFGPLTVNNAMAIVVPTGSFPGPGVLVGLPLLARFKQVEFDQSRLVLDAAASVCKYPLALAFASSPAEDGKLVFAAKANGKPVKASIDTGSGAPLIASPSLMASSTAGNAAAPPTTTALATPSHRHLEVQFGNSRFSYNDPPVIPALSVPDVVIGAPILEGWNVRFDFSKPSLCLIPRHS